MIPSRACRHQIRTSLQHGNLLLDGNWIGDDIEDRYLNIISLVQPTGKEKKNLLNPWQGPKEDAHGANKTHTVDPEGAERKSQGDASTPPTLQADGKIRAR